MVYESKAKCMRYQLLLCAFTMVRLVFTISAMLRNDSMHSKSSTTRRASSISELAVSTSCSMSRNPAFDSAICGTLRWICSETRCKPSDASLNELLIVFSNSCVAISSSHVCGYTFKRKLCQKLLLVCAFSHTFAFLACILSSVSPCRETAC